MIVTTLLIALTLPSQAAAPTNPVYQSLIDRGVESDGVTLALPRPSLADAQDPATSRAVLGEIAGDDRSVENFLRDSVTAPFVLKTRDVKAGESTIRVADLWFAVRGSLDEIDLKQVLGKTEAATVEAGNMRFTSKILTTEELGDRKIDQIARTPMRDEWYTHASGRLLDRIEVEVTEHAVATRTPDSLTVAAITSRSFDNDARYPNRWSTITPAGPTGSRGPGQPYAGGGSYAKITRLAGQPGRLLVEAHFAFVEPHPWFAGNPILRSKLSLICQDQVRQLRREIQKRQAKS